MTETGAAPLTVTEVTELVRGALAVRPELEDVLVEGEIRDFRNPGSGHLYFSLRDDRSQLRCVCFRAQAARIRFMPERGMRVLVRGRVDVYGADGQYQLYVQAVDPVGVGAIALAIEQVARRLREEGLLDERLKRPLPLLPRRVAVVTSSTGAAVRDAVTVLRRRAPGIPVVVVPTPVQGDGAEASVIRAIGRAQRLAEVDVILLVRGGGSIEDLVAFQGEALARAIRSCPVPVVTGIGHETDTTIADLVADRRAATPSNAAELAVPDVAALADDVAARSLRLRRSLRADLARRRAELGVSAQRLDRQSPVRRLPQLRQHLDGRVAALRSALLSEVHVKRRHLDAAASRLALADPARRIPAHREALRGRRVALDGAATRLVDR
ncbi:MAG TPA: exodeoxyribonuclease VII large subunit, partial [Candidatus Dormibacteraeota bacterium]|nr:exodeoxyribonuclease VII large subunit [Candidatus Dormibacteraeota bacterium]